MKIITKFIRVSIFSIFVFFSATTSIISQVLINKTDLFPNFPVPITYPALSSDGKNIVFLSNDNLTKVAYEAFYTDNQWSVPKPLEFINRIINSSKQIEVGGFSFNYDGSILYFHANLNANYDIYFARKVNGKWTEPKNFGIPINTISNEYSPTISTDGKTLLILRDKISSEKDKICKELVLYEKDKSGQWIGPQYLPAIFNSGCQETPFLCIDNKTLLFASERPDTNKLGKKVGDNGYNMYYTKRLYRNVWYIPSYVDELSTEFNDLSPSMEYTGMFFCSNIKASKLKNQPQKIYSTELPDKVKPDKIFLLSGTITDLHSKQPLDASIIAYNAITSIIEGEFSTTDNGHYLIILNAGVDYKIDFFKKGYSHHYLNENTQRLGASETKEYNVTLYNEIKLDLNVFDNEIFYPLSPKITITDSLNSGNGSFQAQALSKGRYTSNLKIGNLYKLFFETENFEPYTDYFDLRTDVQYSSFEKDIELQVAKKIIILNVTDAESNDTIAVNAVVTNLTRNEKTTILAKRDKDGNLIVELREGDRYEIDVAKKGYTYFNTRVDVNKSISTKKLDIQLNALTVKTKMVFNNISFETNSAEFNANSYEDLDRLAKFLNENNEVSVEISAHTDDKGTDAYNINLSFKRAQTVVDYLVTQNVSVNRLKTKGYGKSMPLVPNTSDENRSINRRVELKIIDDTTPIQ